MTDNKMRNDRPRSGSMSFRSPQRLWDRNENLNDVFERRGSLTLTSTGSFPKRRGSLIARWSKHFSDAIESFNRREGKSKLKEPFNDDDSDSERVHDLPPANEVAPERAEAVGGEEQSQSQQQQSIITNISATSSSTKENIVDSEEQQNNLFEDTEGGEKSDLNSDNRDLPTDSPDVMVTGEGGGGGTETTTKISAEDWPLIEPSQVNVAMPPVHTAESMLTPLEQIKRKDALVKQALEDKEDLVADMLSIPREDFQHIADMMVSADTTTSRDPSERVLSAIFQVDQLQKAVNQAMNVSEVDQIVLKGGKHPSCASQQHQQEKKSDDDDHPNEIALNSSLMSSTNHPLTIQVSVVRDIASSLSTELTTLLSEVKHMEEERERLRKELHKVKEALHEQNNLHSPIYQNIINDSISDNLISTSTNTDCGSEQSCSTPLNDSIQIITKNDCEEEEEEEESLVD